MLAYTDMLKARLDPAVYNRGLRLYLDGAVLRPRPLLLDHWRLYEVVEKYVNYEVRVPVLHLTLESRKFDQAYEALGEVARCTCEQFETDGFCRHLVAVFAHLDKEFNNAASPTRITAAPSDLLDSIFTAQKVKTHRKWLATVEQLLTRDTGNYFYLDQISKTIKDEPDEHRDFLDAFGKLLEPHIGYYAQEKRILRIALEAILIGKAPLYNFFRPYILRMDDSHRLQFWVSLWRYYWMGACEGYRDNLLTHLRELDLEQKQSILERLKREYGEQEEVWLEFCFRTQYYRPLVEAKETLSELNLIRLTELVPDLRESTDLILSGHLRTWSDFLLAGQYKDFLALIHAWAEKLGKSEIFVETLKYIIANHKNKRSLVRELKELI